MRFSRWREKGVWARLASALQGDADMGHLFIDSTIVRGHQLSAGAKKAGGQEIGHSRGELTTKLHVAVDALGNPLRVIPSGGEAADITQGTTLIEGLGTEAVITDKGYDDGKLVIPFRNPVYR